MEKQRKIIELPISEIIPYWKNPRKNDNTIPKLKTSIQNYGFNVPILVDESNVIIAGHSRYKACLEMGFNTIPAIVLVISKEQAKELRILDNKIQEYTSYNEDELKNELLSMYESFGLSSVMDLTIYFRDAEVENYFADYKLELDPVEVNMEIDPLIINNIERPVEVEQNQVENQTVVICPYCLHEQSVALDYKFTGSSDTVNYDQQLRNIEKN